MEELSTECMVDTGATGDFIDQDFVTNNKLLTCKLSKPIPVHNVDGTLNEAGSIRKVINVVMTYQRHSEQILLAVTQLGKQSMILGMTWLRRHNPEIDFRTATVKMTRCLPCCCIGCLDEVREQRTAKRKNVTQQINACCTSPFPAIVEDTDNDEEIPAGPECTAEGDPEEFVRGEVARKSNR